MSQGAFVQYWDGQAVHLFLAAVVRQRQSRWYTLVHMPPLRQLLQIEEDELWRIPRTNPLTLGEP
jgi:hypothetical protein